MIDLDGKVALITGSSDGIGAATALLFSSLGAKVAIVGRDGTKLDRVSSECEAKSPHGYKPVKIQADFEKEEDVFRTFKETINGYDRLDILVNNAGVAPRKQMDDPDFMDDYDRIMQINIRSIVQLTLMAKDHLIKAKGVIVNVSSIASIQISPSHWSYCMSKAALDMFTRSMACVLAPDVRVNSLNPGPVRTNIVAGRPNIEQFWEGLAASVPLKRVAEPLEMAQTIAFLASDGSKNMTGSIFVSDSGSLVNDPHKNTPLGSPAKSPDQETQG